MTDVLLRKASATSGSARLAELPPFVSTARQAVLPLTLASARNLCCAC